MLFQSVVPATEKIEASFEEHTPEQVERALGNASRAFGRWSKTPFEVRAGHMREAANYLRANMARFAGLMTAEMGKRHPPVRSGGGEVRVVLRVDAEHAQKFLQRPADAKLGYGEDVCSTWPVLAVMPWNFPFWQGCPVRCTDAHGGEHRDSNMLRTFQGALLPLRRSFAKRASRRASSSRFSSPAGELPRSSRTTGCAR